MQRWALYSNRSSVKLVKVVVAGFPTGVENMGGSSKFDGRGLSQYMGEHWGGGGKILSKIPLKEFI